MLSREYFNRQSVSVSHISIDEESVTVAHSSLAFNSSKIHLPRNQPSFVVCLCSPTQCTLSVGGFKRLIRHSYWLLALVVVCPRQKLSNSHARSLYSLSMICRAKATRTSQDCGTLRSFTRGTDLHLLMRLGARTGW